ncbi:BspA family leucine-rich repeat surface protein, partial [uncultured Gemella sp.]|uniref:BspA family leucine-rich repeat surface protein n=1 Tax=uncultured Gemella sp. TaxID=254352 RepID=UPI0028D36752
MKRDRKEKFSIRKYKSLGAASAVIGVLFFVAGSDASAHENNTTVSVVEKDSSVSNNARSESESSVEPKAATEPKSDTEGLSTGLKDNIEPKAATESKAATEGVLTGLKDNVEPKAATDEVSPSSFRESTSVTRSRRGKRDVSTTLQPEGNVIAHGEDGVPWELYGNGYLLFKPEVGKDTLTNNSGESTWKVNYGEQIKHVGFADKVYAPENSAWLFSKYYLRDGAQTNGGFNPLTFDTMHFDTSKVTNMRYMFRGMNKLTNLDVMHFDTSKVMDMGGMFNDMSNLTNLDVTHFDTSKVTNMGSMFNGMSNLTNLDVTHFDTSKVTNMGVMFNGMANLTNLDVTHFDTSKVTNMGGMFNGMSKLTNLDVTHFDTSKVTNMGLMFNGTIKLKELKLGDKFKADGIRTIPTTHSYGNQYTDKWHKVEDKEHTYTVSDWANAYAGNSTATAGTWVREVSNATLTFQGENFTPVKVTPSDTALPTLSRPSQPKQNHKFLGWSKDGTNLLTRDAVQPGETITLQPLWQPVNNTTTRTEEIPIATIYRADETIPFESRQEVAGQEGVKTITTTYTVAPYTGELTDPVESERVTTEMQPKVIKVGNKKVSTEPILATNKYVGNEEKDRGYSNLITQGQD